MRKVATSAWRDGYTESHFGILGRLCAEVLEVYCAECGVEKEKGDGGFEFTCKCDGGGAASLGLDLGTRRYTLCVLYLIGHGGITRVAGCLL